MKAVLAGAVMLQLTTCGVFAQFLYQIDNNHVNFPINASDGTEPLDNWFGNEFTAVAGGNLITSVDFLAYTVTPGAHAQVVLYQLGNPAIGPTRIYTQTFTVTPGGGSSVVWNHINLTTPVTVDVGGQFIVSVFMPNVIAAPPNDVYPFVVDNSATSINSFWARSAPNTFNLDNLDSARRLDYALAPGGFVPGGHVFIRANGVAVPEPAALALAALGGVLVLLRRRSA